MAEAKINIEQIFANMMFMENVTECGYFPTIKFIFFHYLPSPNSNETTASHRLPYKWKNPYLVQLSA